MNTQGLTLYGTSACHLCERAQALLLPMARQYGWDLQTVDISQDAALVERYGLRIPVLGGRDKGGNGWNSTGPSIRRRYGCGRRSST